MSEKRKCSQEGCITILSLFNDDKICFYHCAVKEGKKVFANDVFPAHHDVGANVDRFFLLVIAEYEGWRR